MKKILLLACAGVLCFSQVNAANCEAGTEITGRNGHVYCKGPHQINWWAAQSWCEAHGRYLASMLQLCPDWDGSSESCSNLTNIDATGVVWSRIAAGVKRAWTVTLGSGRVGFSDDRTDSNYPFCC